jgi:hypothetical protein
MLLERSDPLPFAFSLPASQPYALCLVPCAFSLPASSLELSAIFSIRTSTYFAIRIFTYIAFIIDFPELFPYITHS